MPGDINFGLFEFNNHFDIKLNGRESFQDALIATQEMGVVKEDKSLDLDGYDAAAKLRALLVVLSSTTAFNTNKHSARLY